MTSENPSLSWSYRPGTGNNRRDSFVTLAPISLDSVR